MCLVGCASPPGPVSFDVAAERYESAFDAAKDRLRDAGFDLDRVDARAGVITTEPKFTAGLATPWIGVESTPRQEWSNLLNRQRYRVSVRFEPASKPNSGAEDQPDPGRDARPTDDLRAYDGPMRAEVVARIERLHRPGLRVQADAIRLSRIAVDPALVERGMLPAYAEDAGRDDRLAARLVRGIRRSAGFEPVKPDEAADARTSEVSPAVGPDASSEG